MKILTLSDEECKALWDYYTPGKLKEYDLIISCGDLKASYLSFLVTMARCPLLYVPGNHDMRYSLQPPEGCDCIDDGLWSTTVCGFWDWAAAAAITPAPTSTPKVRCAAGSSG